MVPSRLRAVLLAAVLVPFLIAITLIAAAPAAQGQTRAECEREYRPQIGQQGKDVIWLPTNDALVDRMLTLARTTGSDRLYDLGAGDGKIPIAAAKKYGTTGVGVEYNPELAKFAQCLVKAEGVAGKVSIIQGDVFETDFSDATVVTLYLLPELNVKLRPTILKMKPGTRVVSHSFLMGEWEPDDRTLTDEGAAYLWVVPANLAGTWRFVAAQGTDQFVAQLNQTFQVVTGTLGTGADAKNVTRGRVLGEQLHLIFEGDAGSTELNGRFVANRLDATVSRGDKTKVQYVGTRL